VYLPRSADSELLELARNGTFAFVLAARQMGKSSLMVRTVQQLKTEHIRSVTIDLTKIGTELTAEQWYLGLLIEIQDQLSLNSEVEGWWHEHRQMSFTQRLTTFLQCVLPFDVVPLRALPYRVSPDGKPVDVKATIELLSSRLLEARRSTAPDSPIFQLLADYPNLRPEKTELFRGRLIHAQEIREKLAAARQRGVEQIRLVQRELGDIETQESSEVMDLLLSYREVGAWSDMVALAEKI
jgi:hypothetical protein